jgi:hypothetical protein
VAATSGVGCALLELFWIWLFLSCLERFLLFSCFFGRDWLDQDFGGRVEAIFIRGELGGQHCSCGTVEGRSVAVIGVSFLTSAFARRVRGHDLEHYRRVRRSMRRE